MDAIPVVRCSYGYHNPNLTLTINRILNLVPYFHLSYAVASGSDITPCVKNEKKKRL